MKTRFALPDPPSPDDFRGADAAFADFDNDGDLDVVLVRDEANETARNTLVLKNGIAIATDTGYSAAIDQASLDLGKGSMVSTVPIEIKSSDGAIRANAVSVSDRGKHVVFSGGVSVSFLPKGELAGPAQEK